MLLPDSGCGAPAASQKRQEIIGGMTDLVFTLTVSSVSHH